MNLGTTHHPHFRERHDAGRRLVPALRKFKDRSPVILALPRGGVPVAYEVAKALGAPLDVLFVRKIGAPNQPELALGAVVDGASPQVVLNDEIVKMLRPPPGYIDAEVDRQLAEIERRRMLYTGRQSVDVHGRTVIVIDDGVATGATVKAALKGIDHNDPEWLVLAVPVAPPETLLDLQSVADEVIALVSPQPFWAVGLYYEDFSQTTDEEVMALLGANHAHGIGPGTSESAVTPKRGAIGRALR